MTLTHTQLSVIPMVGMYVFQNPMCCKRNVAKHVARHYKVNTKGAKGGVSQEVIHRNHAIELALSVHDQVGSANRHAYTYSDKLPSPDVKVDPDFEHLHKQYCTKRKVMKTNDLTRYFAMRNKAEKDAKQWAADLIAKTVELSDYKPPLSAKRRKKRRARLIKLQVAGKITPEQEIELEKLQAEAAKRAEPHDDKLLDNISKMEAKVNDQLGK